ncbi:hypothetical protein PYCC9005_003491 [Savitreella phatthalungensis]
MSEVHALYAWESLYAHLSRRPRYSLEDLRAAAGPDITPTSDEPEDDAPAAIFVTWNTLERSPNPHTDPDADDDSGKQLRGCIGTFAATSPLRKQIERYAVIAGVDDTRFNPISAAELDRATSTTDDIFDTPSRTSMQCSVSVLADFTPLAAPYDGWEIGRHGLQISYDVVGGRRGLSATFLPEVAEEQGWTKDQTLDALFRKGGWRPSTRGASWRDEVKITEAKTYRTLKRSATIAKWKAIRARLDAR